MIKIRREIDLKINWSYKSFRKNRTQENSISGVLIAFNFLVVVIVQWMCTHTERSFHFFEKILENDAKNKLICENTVA